MLEWGSPIHHVSNLPELCKASRVPVPKNGGRGLYDLRPMSSSLSFPTGFSHALCPLLLAYQQQVRKEEAILLQGA